MIVGIFGDSFAENINELSWTNLLSTEYNLTVKNFARGSTSLFWSYKKLTTYIDYVDVVIFAVTNPGRLHYSGDNPALFSISSLVTIDYLLKQKLNINDTLRAAKDYYIHLADQEFDEYVHEQLVKSIKELCRAKNKRLILLPSFSYNIKYQDIFSGSLFDITRHELYATFNDAVFRKETTLRANHLSQENNIKLAQLINRLLQNEPLTIDVGDFVFDKKDNPALYWEL